MVSWGFFFCCFTGRWGTPPNGFYFQRWLLRLDYICPKLMWCLAEIKARVVLLCQLCHSQSLTAHLPWRKLQALIWEANRKSVFISAAPVRTKQSQRMKEESEQAPTAHPLCASQFVSGEEQCVKCLLWKIFMACSFQLVSLLYFILLLKEKADILSVADVFRSVQGSPTDLRFSY